jgi:hypothetical protein
MAAAQLAAGRDLSGLRKAVQAAALAAAER